MKFFSALAGIFFSLIFFSPLHAGKVSVGQQPSHSLEDFPRQRTVLPSPISAEGPGRFYAKETAPDDQLYDRKHTVKSGCSCMGCCSGCCKRDQRFKVDPDDALHSANVFITAYFPSYGWKRGSASILSEHCIGTAAHTFYRDGEFATEVMVMFGMRQYMKCRCCFPCETIDDTARAIITNPVFAIHPDFLRDPDSPYDLALMTLKRPSREDFRAAGVDFSPYEVVDARYKDVQMISSRGDFIYGETGSLSMGEQYGVLGMGEYSSDELKNAPITVTGYPAHVGRSCRPLYNMYSARGQAGHIRGGRILHDGDTSDGVSGGAIRLSSTGEIIGMHTGDYNDEYNQGVWFDHSSMDFIRRHLRAFDREWALTNLLMPAEL